MIKPIWKSWTFWFNAITLVLGIFQIITDTYTIDPQVIALVNGIGNVLLRFKTHTAVSLN